MTFERIRLAFDGSVAVLKLADSDTLNAMSKSMLVEMAAALDRITDPAAGVRCVLLTGEGRAFCSGANLTEAATGDFEVGELLDRYYHPALERLRALGRPLVTAVNGPAVGIGMSFALMGDLVLAAESAYFLHAFGRIGLIPDGGSTWLLPRLIGLARARELSFLAEKLPAPKALEWGLINQVHPDDQLMPRALTLAHQLATGPSVALGLMHGLYWESPDTSYADQLAREREAQKKAVDTRDFREAATAFVEKRPPKFEGR